MTIIVFLIDTSASMNQRAYLGGRPTLLDVAKGAVETFVKVRQRSPESRGDRYMLLTFEEPPANIKAGWKENLATFINELKNLQCLGMTTMGAALKHAFDVLNINRMQTGIDTYGQGRCPFYLEPSVIVVITDGGKLSSNAGVQDDFNLPMNCPIPGSELTREPFRWDQRLFSLVLRLSGTPAIERDSGLVPSDSSPIDAMCEVTGGRSYCITSHRMMMQCIDSLVQKVQSGVVINFEKMGPDPVPLEPTPNLNRDGIEIDDMHHDEHKDQYDTDHDKNGTRWNGSGLCGPPSAAWHCCRKLIYVPRTVAQKAFAVGFWPIPESFRPDPNAPTLPPRTAHPAVKFTCSSQEPMVIDNLPFDKYELEPSPLTQFILARKQPTICWQVFIANNPSTTKIGNDVGHTFGYLKASTNLTCVNLFVMPYNYPVLLPLLDDLFKLHRCKPTPEWKAAFQQYLDRMPSYYLSPLRRALAKMGAPNPLVATIMPDQPENNLSFSVLNYLKRLKNQAKMEFDKLCNDVVNKGSAVNNQKGDTVRVVPRSPLKKELTTHPCLQDKFAALRDQLNEFGGFVVGLSRGRHKAQAHTYRNPFDIQRRDLLDQVVRMRANFLQPSLSHTRLVDDDSLHSMPVAQMGNYQEYLKRQPAQLREIESTPVRQHMFGNPFKIDKRMMVDEADIDGLGSTTTGRGTAGVGVGAGQGTGTKRAGGAADRPPPPKRRAGPLPLHVVARRPAPPTPTPYSTLPAYTPPSSPAPQSPAPVLIADVAPGRPPDDMPLVIDTGGHGGVSTVSGGVATPPFRPASPPLNTVGQGHNLPPVIKPIINGDAYLSVCGRPPRSPSPPPAAVEVSPMPLVPISMPKPPAPDQQELQISAILQGIAAAAENNSSRKKGRKPKSEAVPLVQSPATPAQQSAAHVMLPAAHATPHTAHVTPPALTHFTPLGPLAAVPLVTRKEMAEVRRHNLDVRAEAYRAVRRPGRDFTLLFNQLKLLKGGIATRREVVQEVIHESLRFKRKALAKLLEDFAASLERNGNSTNTNNNTVQRELRTLTSALYNNSVQNNTS